MRRRVFVAAALAAGLISACAPPVTRITGEVAPKPPGFPDAYYQQAVERGDAVFRIEPDRSSVVIEVRRSGSLSRLGHDHVIASHDVRGFVAPSSGRCDLYVRLDRLVVDEPALRAEAGFDTQPSDADIAGTRDNMLAKVLHADLHPFVVVGVAGTDSAGRLNVAITLNGVTRSTQVPAHVDTGVDELSATGQLSIEQTDFGITPFSILGGAIQVQNQVDLRFRIRARRIAR